MSFWKIAWRNIKQRALASSLTGLSMALGVALMILVIVIYDVTGRECRVLASGFHGSGPRDATWDGCASAGQRVGPGVYLARLEAGETIRTLKLVLTR